MGKAFSTSIMLDDAVIAVKRTAGRWLGILLLTTIPLRLMQVHVFREICYYGEQTKHYGNHFFNLSLLTMVLFVISLYGRMLYVRAIYTNLESSSASKSISLKLPAGKFLEYLYSALAIEVLFFASSFTIFSPFLFIVPAGLLAAVIHSGTKNGGIKRIKELMSVFTSFKPLLAILIVHNFGFIIIFIGIMFSMRVILWFAEGLIQGKIAFWRYMLVESSHFGVPSEPLVLFLIIMLVMILLEPFWLSSMTTLVYKKRMQKSGDDLRRKLNDIKEMAN